VQILTNLLSNSLLHAWAPGEPGRITLGVENRGNSVLLWFADDGVGIPLENQSHIFEPFFTTKRGRGGTGLGLNIVFNLVNNVLGGIIACVSKPGEGTRFNILLPRKPPA
jgi:signal transduction histidine kinase